MIFKPSILCKLSRNNGFYSRLVFRRKKIELWMYRQASNLSIDEGSLNLTTVFTSGQESQISV